MKDHLKAEITPFLKCYFKGNTRKHFFSFQKTLWKLMSKDYFTKNTKSKFCLTNQNILIFSLKLKSYYFLIIWELLLFLFLLFFCCFFYWIYMFDLKILIFNSTSPSSPPTALTAVRGIKTTSTTSYLNIT